MLPSDHAGLFRECSQRAGCAARRRDICLTTTENRRVRGPSDVCGPEKVAAQGDGINVSVGGSDHDLGVQKIDRRLAVDRSA